VKLLAISVLSLSIALSAHAQRDDSLSREIKTWKKGNSPPARLLRFPDGNVDRLSRDHLRVWGSGVEDYVSEIQDVDLLVALLFDHRSQPESFRAAASRLIRLRGVSYVSHLLKSKRTEEPAIFTSPLATLSQLLRSPYVAIKVADISSEDMESHRAEEVLTKMRAELVAGNSWGATYRKFADLHPDLRARAKDPQSISTLIRYLYDGIVAPSGFDILNYSIAADLPTEHLQKLFQAETGTHIFKAGNRVILYHIEHYFNDAA